MSKLRLDKDDLVVEPMATTSDLAEATFNGASNTAQRHCVTFVNMCSSCCVE